MRGNKKGATLIEVVIGVALMGLIATGFFMALNTSIKATGMVDERTTAESLTRSELEYIKNCVYVDWIPGELPNYGDGSTRSVAGFPGFEITSTAIAINPVTHASTDPDLGMQLITVQVDYQSELILTTEAYKVQR